MISLIQRGSENPIPVTKDPVISSTDQGSQQRFAPKVLALTGILQTTLETNELIALFAKELAGFISFDGLAYRFADLNVDIHLGQPTTHICSYRLVVSGEALGEIALNRAYRFREKELETVENLLAALLYPLRNALLYQRALATAMIDPLTGVKNRTTMDSTIQREIQLARRQESQLSAILLDVDHFKRINDRFGHLCGDQALRSVAQCAEQTIRNSDMLFRYGGEEFLILLTGTDLGGAQLLAERIRLRIQQLDPHSEHRMQLTASLGVGGLRDDDTAKSFLARVDDALYQAKQSGRNRVIAR